MGREPRLCGGRKGTFPVGPGGKFSESGIARKDPNLEVWGFLLFPSLAELLWAGGGETVR